MMQSVELSFDAGMDKGDVDAVLLKPDKPAALLVLAHGAGAGCRHQHMTSIAEAFLAHDIATLRFNFPYMQQGKPRTDMLPVCINTIANAIQLARIEVQQAPLFIGGHSFGGRMSSHYMAESSDVRVSGVICFSFPLHNPKKLETKRADHLYDVNIPMLFLTGTRDGMADLSLLEGIVRKLQRASLHTLDTANHGYTILKRTRQSGEDVYHEAARVATDWIASL